MSIISNRLPNIQLIGIHGHAGAGKDTLGRYLAAQYMNTWCESFSAPLKEACAAAFGMVEDQFNDTELKEIPDPYWKLTPRQILQFMGTEIFRTHVSSFTAIPAGDFWIHRMHGRLTSQLLRPEIEGEYEDGDTIILTDVRFQNEYEYITQNGGIVIHISRDGADGQVGLVGHASESTLNFTQPEVTYALENNGTLEELYEKARLIVKQAELELVIEESESI